MNRPPPSPSPFQSSHRPAAAGPLAGVKVLDLSAYIAGPYGCTLLADQGADVIKIEPPAGDNLRHYPSTLEGENRAFLGVNRSKQGLVLDLKQPGDLAIFEALAIEADVLVHNFRPGVPERLRIGYERLAELNPRLIYCAVTGYGEDGPMRGKAGYDQVLQAMTGMCVLQGKPGGPPELTYGSPVDYYAAAMVATGVASALYERERSGTGQYVGVSLLRSALTMQSARMIKADGELHDISRDMRSGGITGLHPTADGYLYLSANTRHFWEALCRLTDLPDLASDPRYDSVRKRAQHAGEIVPRLRQRLALRAAREWEELLGDEVPCSIVRPVEDMFNHPQVLAENMMATIEHDVLGHYRGVAAPVKFGRTPSPPPFAAPAHGQDSDRLREAAKDKAPKVTPAKGARAEA
jgi:crotonobetainyl-CoA:carnitine CoA-transferase CaiB-like acyl-CoA transferase